MGEPFLARSCGLFHLLPHPFFRTSFFQPPTRLGQSKSFSESDWLIILVAGSGEYFHQTSLARLATKQMKYLILSVLLSVISAMPSWAAEQAYEYDVVVYGGTSAAVMAAVQSHRMGKSVVIVAPDKHLGGLSSGGLGFTDIGNRLTVGGLAREFYENVFKHYDKPEAWTRETPDAFHQKKIGWRKMWKGENTRWVFEPHVAEAIFDQFICRQ